MVVTGKLSIRTLTGTLPTSSATAGRQTMEDEASVPPLTLEPTVFVFVFLLTASYLLHLDSDINELYMQSCGDHLRMLHRFSPKKTFLWKPESRCLPVSVTVVPPNTGP